MKDMLKFGFVLFLVAVLATASLSWVNAVTRPRILAQEKVAVESALSAVLPGCESGIIVPFSHQDEIQYYLGYAQTDSTDLKGVAFQAMSQGYSSLIKTMVGMDTSGTIYSIRVLSQKETPGLGTKVEAIKSGQSEPYWQMQFKGKQAVGLSVDKDGGIIESVTGATITSRAITGGISAQAEQVLARLHQRAMDTASSASPQANDQ